MSKYRRKPTIVEAIQFRERDYPNDPPGVFRGHSGRPYVITIHGQDTTIADGDFLIREPDGVHFYPCKPDIFAATYEPTDDTTEPTP